MAVESMYSTCVFKTPKHIWHTTHPVTETNAKFQIGFSRKMRKIVQCLLATTQNTLASSYANTQQC